MEMTLRWYGKEFDTVKLWQIRQIPGVKGVITTLYNKQAGELWTEDEIIALKKDVADEDMHIAGIESVNISDDIKTAGPKRDEHIDNYIKTLENLGKQDIHMVCYNFMPVFDWTRSELARKRHDGSTVLAYSQSSIDAIDPANMFDSIKDQMNGTVMPGWEPERLDKVRELFEAYKDIDENKLFDNLVYFLKAIMPVCDKYDINMAIHPDDPAWSVFGLPRIINNKKNISRMLDAVDNVHNGLTFCSGSFGTNPENDLPDMIRSFKGRVHFAHVRNLQFNSFCHEDGSCVKAWTGKDIPVGKPDFEEAAHLSSDGSFDMYEIVRALYESGFDGPIRPDHGRMIWGEEAMPGYGLYDRALGAAYINGLWEAIEKAHGGVR
ncbi:MAG: mannonate dehydratase [Lachnospiraceae bacterium]|nr:mannonate dehydratase [Lachnospiraceae bacterium]